MAERKYKSLKEFYPYYLTEHADPVCRAFHFIGTSLIFVLIGTAIALGKWWLLALIPVAGYGFAWAGHAIFERNKPATFTYPVWSLASDFIMYFDMITFRIGGRLQAAKQTISAGE